MSKITPAALPLAFTLLVFIPFDNQVVITEQQKDYPKDKFVEGHKPSVALPAGRQIVPAKKGRFGNGPAFKENVYDST